MVAPLLVVLTSAMGVTVVITLAFEEAPLLFDASGSVEAAVLETVFVSERPVLGAAMVTVKFVVALAVKLVSVGQIIDPLLFVPPLEALTNVVFVGKRSLTMTFVALFGPMFVTVMV